MSGRPAPSGSRLRGQRAGYVNPQVKIAGGSGGPGDPLGRGLSPVLGVDLTSSRDRSVHDLGAEGPEAGKASSSCGQDSGSSGRRPEGVEDQGTPSIPE